jgi:hypothetical protein
MYAVTRSQFTHQIEQLLAGNTAAFGHVHHTKHEQHFSMRCPACSAAS